MIERAVTPFGLSLGPKKWLRSSAVKAHLAEEGRLRDPISADRGAAAEGFAWPTADCSKANGV